MNRPRPSWIVRGLQPWLGSAWIFFCLGTLWIGAVWGMVAGLVAYGDLGWILFAAMLTYGWLSGVEGLPTARRWAMTIGVGAMLVGLAGVYGGWPMGRLRFSAPLGMKMGPVPIGWLMLWFTLLIGARQAAQRAMPRAGHWQVALLTGFLLAVTDGVLEPVASPIRGWWFWRGTPVEGFFSLPWTHYLGWWIVGSGLAGCLRGERSADPRLKGGMKPLTIYLLFNAVCLVANLGRWLRG